MTTVKGEVQNTDFPPWDIQKDHGTTKGFYDHCKKISPLNVLTVMAKLTNKL